VRCGRINAFSHLATNSQQATEYGTFEAITNIMLKNSLTCLLTGFSTRSVIGQVDFGAFYTKLNTGQRWESYSRTGECADIVVRLSHAGGDLVFWRGNSYLPYWRTDGGRWDLPQIVPRRADGPSTMPDRVNLYSHTEIIENKPSRVVVHWRYLVSFTAGTPQGNVDPDHFVEEVFTITPDGRRAQRNKP
jgi:hypothetical protein